MQYTTAAWLGF